MGPATQAGGGSARPISVIFEVLPTSIQAIIPPIPSLRRSVSQRRMKATSLLPGALFVLQPQDPISSSDSLHRSSTDDVRLVVEEDMEESHTDESSSTVATTDSRDVAQYPTRTRKPSPELVDYAKPQPQPQSGIRMGFHFLRLRRPGSANAATTSSSCASAGIDRKFQRRGRELLRDAEAEADPSNPDPNPAFERRAYLDGVAYLLQGLPRDLDEVEVSIIRHSLPESLRQEFSMRQQNQLPGGCSSMGGGSSELPQSGSPSPRSSSSPIGLLRMRGGGPSPVHRTVQTLMTGFIFMLRLLMSVSVTAVQEVVRVGQEYQIPERVTRQTLSVASSFASLGTTAASTIGSVSKASYAMVDDRVGNGLGHMLQWFADETIAGVCDGVRDGLRYQVYQERR